MKLKDHQRKWQPCEHEALAITAAVKHFAPYIRESKHPFQILSDSKPCVQAFAKLRKGEFSASSRVSTFLSCLSEHHITMCHIKGDANKSSDYASRNPRECTDSSCQICKFVYDTASSVVRSVAVIDVLSGKERMPFLNREAWRAAQHDCDAMRRTYAHLSQGTRPSRKAKNIKDVRRYLQVASISDAGLLIHRKNDPYVLQRDLIIISKDILSVLLTALHLHFDHLTRNQLSQLFNRYFYGICSDAAIKSIVDNCAQCNSLKHFPKEIFQQSSSPTPTGPGQQFACDVICRSLQKICVVRDVHSSFTSATIIPDETAVSLRSALLTNTSLLRTPSSIIRVDNAPGFQNLKSDQILSSNGITLEFGRVKNPNRNPVAEKANQELEDELLRLDPTGAAVTVLTLEKAVIALNTKIRNRGLSAKEILFCRDQITGEVLAIEDEALSQLQESLRAQNHIPSATSKAKGCPKASDAQVNIGDLVYIKSEGNKFKGREKYMVMQINNNGHVMFQKINCSKFMSCRYEVPLSHIYPVVQTITKSVHNGGDSDSTEYEDDPPEKAESLPDDDITLEPAVDFEHTAELEQVPNVRPQRNRQEPEWLRSEEWER